MDNSAQDTANKIVDSIVSNNPNRVEDSLALLSNKLHEDGYSADTSSKGQDKFIADVFSDVNAQYMYGKSLPSDLSFAWANQQLGHELPKDGFNRDDLKAVQASTDASVTTLDKFMAGQLVSHFDELQEQARSNALGRYFAADECKGYKKIVAENPDNPYTKNLGNCDDKFDPADTPRMQGVIRQILPADVQTRLNFLDGRKPGV
jgi:hypothetical protein